MNKKRGSRSFPPNLLKLISNFKKLFLVTVEHSDIWEGLMQSKEISLGLLTLHSNTVYQPPVVFLRIQKVISFYQI